MNGRFDEESDLSDDEPLETGIEPCAQCDIDVDIHSDIGHVERHGEIFCSDDCADEWEEEDSPDPEADSERLDEAD